MVPLLPLLLLLAGCAPALAHIEIRSPPARGSRYGPWAAWDSTATNEDGSRVDVDYSNTDPLGGRRTFPCAGKKAGPIVATYSAGDSIDVVLTGSATHDGGHWLVLPRNGVSSLLFLTCAADGSMDSQFALSYDAGVSWVVLKTVYRECLRGEGYNYSVPIPSSAPKADRAVLLWTWMNAIGNREYYTNCADIAIKGTGSSISGVQLLVTNLAPPIENTVTLPEFPGTNTAACDGKYLLDSRPSATMDASGKVSPSGVFTGKDLESKISTNCKDTYVPPPNAPAGNGNGNATAQPLNSGTAGGPMTTVAKSGATRRAVAVALVAMLLAVGMGDLFII